MTDVPSLSSYGNVVIDIGASKISFTCNGNDPRLFVTLPVTVPNVPHATSHPLFLIDSGATHNVLSDSFARRHNLLRYANSTNRIVSGFDGSTRSALFDIRLRLHDAPTDSHLIITTLKDSYDGILGMPWLCRNGHLVDWANRCLLSPTAAVHAVSSSPPKPSPLDSPRRDARILTRGCVSTHPTQLEDTLAPPHCKSFQPLNSHDSASQCAPVNPIGLFPARTSWSTSARLAARNAAQAPTKSIEELIPAPYHQYLRMFQKSAAQGLPPRRRYDFRVELLPDAMPQASRIIPLSPAENEALDTLINEGLANSTIRRTTSPWAAPVIFAGKKDGNL